MLERKVLLPLLRAVSVPPGCTVMAYQSPAEKEFPEEGESVPLYQVSFAPVPLQVTVATLVQVTDVEYAVASLGAVHRQTLNLALPLDIASTRYPETTKVSSVQATGTIPALM